MADFSYIAINKEGKQVKGNLQAPDANAVKSKLRLDGLTPVSVKTQNILTKDIEIGGGGKKVKPRDLSIFCRQFTSILNAGVPVVEALRMMAEQTENKTFRSTLYKTKELVQQGSTLAEAMAKSPKVFPEMFVNMVAAGEVSGSLELCVSRMGTQFEKSSKLSGMVKKAMVYPIAVIIIAIVVLIVMSTVVVPKFAVMFAEMGSDLPASTKIVMGISDVFIHKWYVILAITVGLILFFGWFGRTDQGKYIYGRIALGMPIFGKINTKSNSAKFARTMSTLISSGMGITAAIEITAKTMGNVLFKKALESAKLEVEQGVPLSVPIRKSKVFPSMVNNMLAIGEETGAIESMMDKVAEYYEEETEQATGSLAELLQPIIIVVLGGLVGLMVLALYQPMINMYGSVGNL